MVDLRRGVEKIYPSRAALEKRLTSGEPLRIYYGIDPTGPDVHLGHGVPLRKLREFQNDGHKIILLIGDFTAMIGDPTGKLAARTQLSREQVLKNSQTYLDQIGKILDLTRTEVRYNSEWLAKLDLGRIIDLASKITYAQIIKRDMFQKRLEQNKEIFFSEFLYPLMHGYDSVALDVDLEVGGHDQLFNMLVGRDLLKKVKDKEKFVLATKLLAPPGGIKMSKTEGNIVALTDEPNDMFGKIMSWPDGILRLAFELCTSVPTSEYEKVLARPPRDAKLWLAEVVVGLYHGDRRAKNAKENFLAAFQRKEVPADVKEIMVRKGAELAQVAIDHGLESSKSEFNRLVEQGGVKILPDHKITSRHYVLNEDQVIRFGKKKIFKFVVK